MINDNALVSLVAMTLVAWGIKAPVVIVAAISPRISIDVIFFPSFTNMRIYQPG